jgi:hypothetical protein
MLGALTPLGEIFSGLSIGCRRGRSYLINCMLMGGKGLKLRFWLLRFSGLGLNVFPIGGK